MIGREEERPGGGPFPVAGQELGPVAAKVSLLQQDGRWNSARLELLFSLVKSRLERKGFAQRAVGHHSPYQHLPERRPGVTATRADWLMATYCLLLGSRT